MKKTLLILLFCIGALLRAQAQNDSLAVKPGSLAAPADTAAFKPAYKHGVKYIIKTKTGVAYIGFIVSETKQFVKLENREQHETYEIRRSEILSVTVFSDKRSLLQEIGENHHAGNYMFAGSAFLFDPHRPYSSTYHWMLIECTDYAFTKNWALTMNSIAIYPFSLGIKCAYGLDELNFIGGTFFAMGNAYDRTGKGFLGYGGSARFTRGTSNQNFTLSGGVLGLNSDLIFTAPSLPFFNVPYTSMAYCNRLNQKVALNLEGWFFPKLQTALAGIGFKLVGDRHSCWTFGCYGLLNNFNSGNINLDVKALPIPYVGLSQKF